MADGPEFKPLSILDGKASGEDEAEPGSLPGIEDQYDLRRAGIVKNGYAIRPFCTYTSKRVFVLVTCMLRNPTGGVRRDVWYVMYSRSLYLSICRETAGGSSSTPAAAVGKKRREPL